MRHFPPLLRAVLSCVVLLLFQPGLLRAENPSSEKAAEGALPPSPTGRRWFYDNEEIPLAIRASGDKAELVFSASGGRTFKFSTPVGADGLARVTAPAHAFSAGEWTLDSGQDRRTFHVVSSIRRTPFTICNYQGWLEDEQPPFYGIKMPPEERMKLWRDVFGVNTLMIQKQGDITPAIADRLVRGEMIFSSSYTIAGTHQPGGDSRNDWSEKEVVESSRWVNLGWAQNLRRWPGFFGIHYADEPGLTWGIQNKEEMHALNPGEPVDVPKIGKEGYYAGPMAVPAQRTEYKTSTRKDAPKNWQKPFDDFESWMEWMRWRTGVIGRAFSVLTRDLKRISPEMKGYSQIYSWKWIQDGAYIPEMGKGVDILSSHGYNIYEFGLWYQPFETDAMRVGAWDKPLWFLPAWKGFVNDDGMRLVSNASLSRKVEGLTLGLDFMQDFPSSESYMKKIRPLTGLMAVTKKGRDPVGLFYSRDQHLWWFAQPGEVDGFQTGQIYPGRLASAWLTSNSAGFPVTFFTEEDLLAGQGRAHKVILVAGLTYARPETVKALEKYVSEGGTLLMDKASTVKIKGAKPLALEFPDYYGVVTKAGAKPETVKSDRRLFDELIRPHVESLRKELSPVTPAAAVFDNPMLLPSVHPAGEGRYLWLVNMYQDDKSPTRHTPAAAQSKVTLPRDGVIYDVFASRKLDSRELTLDLAPGEARIYAVLPVDIVSVKSEGTWSAPSLEFKTRVEGKTGAIAANIPLRIVIKSPDGTVYRDLSRATTRQPDGSYALTEKFPLGSAVASGKWTVETTELLSGKSSISTFDLKSDSSGLKPTPDVEVFDPEKIRSALVKQKGAIRVMYGDDSLKSLAEKTADLLKVKGLTARVEKVTPQHLEKRPGSVYGSIYNLYGFAPLQMNEQVVLIGNAQNNPLISHLQESYKILPLTVSAGNIGKGRAALVWNTAMFGIDNDIITIFSPDEAGLEKSLSKLEELIF